MARVEVNPAADRLVLNLGQIAVITFGLRWREAARARVHVISGLLKEAIELSEVEVHGQQVSVTLHDGPGFKGKLYGVAEEVMRGGDHAFIRPSLDETWHEFTGIVNTTFNE